jgi:very-short-patch-repair endonuclease
LRSRRLSEDEIAVLTHSADIDRAIRMLAAAQRTIVTHDQLLGCGLGRKAIAYRRRQHRLSVVFQGVYTTTSGPLPPLAREQAALLACGDGSFLSHSTSAAMWKLVAGLPREPHVTMIGRHVGDRTGLHVHRAASADPQELDTQHGLAVSSPARALLEIAATASSDLLEAAFDEAIAKHVLELADIAPVLERHPGSRGSARLRALVEEARSGGFTRSWGERRLRTLLRRAGIAQPETNFRIGPYRADFAWRRERVIVEFDGYDTHGTRAMFESDRARDAALAALGWLVIRFTWRQLRYRPELILFRLGQVMSLRARAG